MFVAEKGNGSYLNNQRIRVSNRKKLENCMIFTGGPGSSASDRETALKEYEKFSSKVLVPIRKMGSASLDLAYVAAGRCDGFWQRNLKYWDIAAGIILIKEAGGQISDFKGNDQFVANQTVLATNSKISEEMIEVLK